MQGWAIPQEYCIKCGVIKTTEKLLQSINAVF